MSTAQSPVPPVDTTSRWELIRALGSLADTPAAAVATALGLQNPDPADHTEVFAFQAPPYASFYLDSDGMLGGEVAARIGGFWQALGYPVPDQPDHLAALLGLYGALGERERTEDMPARRLMLGQARRALLSEHLLPWVGVFIDVVRQTGIAPWPEWAALLDESLANEATTTPTLQPRHLSEPPDPIEDCGDVRSLLTPVRSGMVITRTDLARCARHSGLGVRLTGRLPTLQALLDQSPAAVLTWLRTHAGAWEERHRNRIPNLGPIASFWSARAAHCHNLLDPNQKPT